MKQQKHFLKRILCLLVLFGLPYLGFSQANQIDSIRKQSINVFIDTYADLDYIKKQIYYVNYVRETKDADVYILVTSQSTGSGGSEYSILFNGQRKYQGMNDTLIYVSQKNATQDEIREGQTKILKLGLMKYIQLSPISNLFEINYLKPENKGMKTVKDPWNNWVYSMSLQGYANGQSTSKYSYFYGSAKASKTTKDIKMALSASSSISNNWYDVTSDTLTAETKSYSVNENVLWSISEHFSIGQYASYAKSFYNNLENSFSLTPAIEYSVLPYAEATRKQFCIQYRITSNYVQHIDTTKFDKYKQLLFKHSLYLGYAIKQKWGNIYTGISGTQYFNDSRFNSLSINTSMEIRVVKGLSLSFSGGTTFQNDSPFLRKRQATMTEMFLGIIQLPTTYSTYFSFGINLSFGSIYNNIVNPRFNSGGNYSISIGGD